MNESIPAASEVDKMNRIEQRWNADGTESWCIISGDLIIGFGPGEVGRKLCLKRKDDAGLHVWQNCPDFTLAEPPSRLPKPTPYAASRKPAEPSPVKAGEGTPPSENAIQWMAGCDTSTALDDNYPVITMSDVGKLARAYLYLRRVAALPALTPEPITDDLISIANSLTSNPDWRSVDMYHALLKAFRLGGASRSLTPPKGTAGTVRRLDSHFYCTINGKLYVRWEYAGGPDQCSHGYDACFSCPNCEQTKAVLPLTPEGIGSEPRSREECVFKYCPHFGLGACISACQSPRKKPEPLGKPTDCVCGHLHSEITPCPVCVSCKFTARKSEEAQLPPLDVQCEQEIRAIDEDNPKYEGEYAVLANIAMRDCRERQLLDCQRYAADINKRAEILEDRLLAALSVGKGQDFYAWWAEIQGDARFATATPKLAAHWAWDAVGKAGGESAEDAFKRGQQNMIELTAAALDMADLPEKAKLWREMMAPFPYVAPKLKEGGVDEDIEKWN